ncbi:isocitrate/isopropylmalate family dehydrogenase [Actinotignum urinale]|nr:isocitrate/isopropylmalate family dehydrogenase [Actinotignum urinale]WIK59822.1 isocitrate/isopropylmalate family dehydrogenase [Actinotignum urinale]
MNPHQFDVIVTENLYGDILSDLMPGLIGGTVGATEFTTLLVNAVTKAKN